MKVDVALVLCDRHDTEQRRAVGTYSGKGRIVTRLDGVAHLIDPEFYGKNPRRFMAHGADGEFRWSRWYLRSMMLQTKPAKMRDTLR